MDKVESGDEGHDSPGEFSCTDAESDLGLDPGPSLRCAAFVDGTNAGEESYDVSMLDYTMTSSPSALTFSVPVLDSFCYDLPVCSLESPTAPVVTSEVSLSACRPSDSLRSTTAGRSCDNDPMTAAAYLHLLGEALLLIGHNLQETDKRVCMSTSLSVLLDSLLCTLAPLMSLSSQIPELRGCLEHTVDPTLENVSHLMPGL